MKIMLRTTVILLTSGLMLLLTNVGVALWPVLPWPWFMTYVLLSTGFGCAFTGMGIAIFKLE